MTTQTRKTPAASFRLPGDTLRQIAELSDKLGMTKTGVLSRAVDRLYQQETMKMSDHQTYKTRKDAQAEILMMRGWDAKAVKLVLPDDPNADKDGNAWVIQCDGDKYMRTDGFVR